MITMNIEKFINRYYLLIVCIMILHNASIPFWSTRRFIATIWNKCTDVFSAMGRLNENGESITPPTTSRIRLPKGADDSVYMASRLRRLRQGEVVQQTTQWKCTVTTMVKINILKLW